jgi:hypothetical protein
LNSILVRKFKFPKKALFLVGLIIVPTSVAGWIMYTDYQSTLQACQENLCDVDSTKISRDLEIMKAPVLLESRITAENRVFNYLNSKGFEKQSNYPLITQIRQVTVSEKVSDFDKKEVITVLAKEYSDAAMGSIRSYSSDSFVVSLVFSIMIAFVIAVIYSILFINVLE